MEELNEEVCSKAEDGVSKEEVRALIDKRQLVEWSYETAKKLLKGTPSPSPTEKTTTADL